MRRGLAAAAIVVLCVGGTASAAAAASSGDAGAATDAIQDDLDTTLTASERRCVEKRLKAEPRLAAAVLSSDGDLDDLDDTSAGELLKIVANCAPEALLRELADEDLFDGIEAPSSELRCFARGFGSLDREVLVAAAKDTDFDDLPADSQNQVFELLFDCMPVTMGRGIYRELATSTPGVPSQPTDRQAKCIGTGVADALASGGGAAVLVDDDPPPEVVGSMMTVMADCTPDALVVLLSESIRDSGATKKQATCVAKALVRKPALIEALIVAEAGGGDLPPEFESATKSCL